MKAFLLIGQSNMAGRGDFGEVEEINNPRCKMLRNARWQPMSEPICPDRSPFVYYHSGVGLSASFADEFAKHFGEDVGLIPCADGGTRLEEWQPGTALFANTVAQCKLAQKYAGAEIVGILWHQGESDSTDARDVALYHDRFLTMLNAMKAEIGISDDVPVLIGELGEFVGSYENGRCAYFKTVNEILSTLASELPRGAFVSAKGLTSKEDHIHFNSASYREFGKRYFEAYRTVVEK